MEQNNNVQKIYCFINGGNGTDWNNVLALCEDGHALAGHISSTEWFAKQDIGINSDDKHQHYKDHCPNGYELIWVDDPANSPHVSSAYAKNQELAAKASLEKAKL